MSEKRSGIFEGYTEDEDLPFSSYTTVMALFNLIFAAVLLYARASGRSLPERVKLSDVVLFGVATHKLTWLVSKDVVTIPLRAPFTRLQEIESPSSVQEKPRESGPRRSLGELVTCKFCLGMWVSAFFVYGRLFAPKATRLAGTIFAVLTLSDFLHQTYEALVKRSS